ncbi:MAG: PAS domain-containing sensor histidine kinase [Aggregatilineales bacterium]
MNDGWLIVVIAFGIGLALGSVACALAVALVWRQVKGKTQTAEARWRALIEHDNDMIAILNERGIITYFSPSTTRIMGYEPDNMLGVNWQSFVHPEDVERVTKLLEPLFSVAATVNKRVIGIEARIQHKDGGWRLIEATFTNLLFEPTVRGVVINARDVTDRQRMEQTLHATNEQLRAQQELAERIRAEANLQRLNTELEERIEARTAQLQQRESELRAVCDAMGESLISLENMRIRYANRALFDLTGYTAQELIGQSITLLDPRAVKETVPLWDKVAQTVRSGAIWRGESTWQRKDGSSFDVAVSIRRLDLGNSSAIDTVLVARDITVEKELGAQKNRFIANASHELRTPLTNLKTRLYLIHRQPERAAEHLAVLDRVTERMAHLVEDLLDLSRFDRGVIQLHPQRLALQSIVNEVIQMQRPEAERKQIILTSTIPPQAVMVTIDPDRVSQVLVNLVVNALNYTPEGGQVNVQLFLIEDDALIQVRDTGIGIKPEHIGRLFEPFFRASDMVGRGAGLGLSIAREIVLLHGGALTVESTPGHGSVFSVRLPREQSIDLVAGDTRF